MRKHFSRKPINLKKPARLTSQTFNSDPWTQLSNKNASQLTISTNDIDNLKSIVEDYSRQYKEKDFYVEPKPVENKSTELSFPDQDFALNFLEAHAKQGKKFKVYHKGILIAVSNGKELIRQSDEHKLNADEIPETTNSTPNLPKDTVQKSGQSKKPQEQSVKKLSRNQPIRKKSPSAPSPQTVNHNYSDDDTLTSFDSHQDTLSESDAIPDNLSFRENPQTVNDYDSDDDMFTSFDCAQKTPVDDDSFSNNLSFRESPQTVNDYDSDEETFTSCKRVQETPIDHDDSFSDNLSFIESPQTMNDYDSDEETFASFDEAPPTSIENKLCPNTPLFMESPRTVTHDDSDDESLPSFATAKGIISVYDASSDNIAIIESPRSTIQDEFDDESLESYITAQDALSSEDEFFSDNESFREENDVLDDVIPTSIKEDKTPSSVFAPLSSEDVAPPIPVSTIKHQDTLSGSELYIEKRKNLKPLTQLNKASQGQEKEISTNELMLQYRNLRFKYDHIMHPIQAKTSLQTPASATSKASHQSTFFVRHSKGIPQPLEERAKKEEDMRVKQTIEAFKLTR